VTRTARPITDGAAPVLASVARALGLARLPVRLRTWDGTEAGPAGAPAVVLRSPRALRRLLWHPGELGLAQAYVAGDLDVDGDLADGLRRVWQSASPSRNATLTAAPRFPRPAAAWAVGRAAARLRVLGPPPPAPASQLRVSGRRHSRSRDRAVIAGHYDLPARFYQLILDPRMAYSCAYWPAAGAAGTLAGAQRDKLDLICAKLALGPGVRLLDLGCGWGSLAIHAAREYQARVTAVTLSAEQGRYVTGLASELGLGELVDVRVQDYRDAAGGPYDAIASVEMGEHVGAARYPRFCATLAGLVRPGGRVLVQQMSRGSRAPGGGPFIESFIAPDMDMRPVGETVAMLESAGLEVRGVEAMREHYVRTIRAWSANFERNVPEITALIGAERVRVWRLYLAGGALAFEAGRMGVHQIVAGGR
jgi:cyclopropane-fatty-acyl-phospholipid synthase